MRTFSEIYNNIVSSFKKRTNLDITKGTVLDSYLLATTEGLAAAHQEIEDSKNPHIYTNLKGKNIDKMALLINCPRRPNESDQSYLYRCMLWTLNNETCNATCIENALSNLTYASNASYVPYTQGTGTATIYIIPKDYDFETEEKAIEEVKDRLSKVTSPDSYYEYKIATQLPIRIICYANIDKQYDIDAIKNNIEESIKEYINSIAIGDNLSYGALNKIGLAEEGVSFFNATHIYINDYLMTSLNTVQTIDTKFLYDEIIWELVVD